MEFVTAIMLAVTVTASSSKTLLNKIGNVRIT
jgi:hypothetical protein